MPAPFRSSSRLRVLKQGAAATDGLFIVQNEKRKQLFKKIEDEEKTRCSCCRCIAQYAHSNKSLVGITCDISAVITQIGAGRWPIYQASGPIVIYPTPQPSVKSLHTNTPCRKPKTSSSPKNSALVTEQ